MNFPAPLEAGVLRSRHKRFTAFITLAEGQEIVAHCPNSGALLDAREPGTLVWVSPASTLKRKLAYTWQMVELAGNLVGINTSLPNLLVEEALAAGKLPPLQVYQSWKREVVTSPGVRFDFRLQQPGFQDCFLEVKSVHLKRKERAVFPDCVTARGTKHLLELIELVQQGRRAVMLYVVQRQDCKALTFAPDLDPLYTQVAKKAKIMGVEFFAYQCKIGLGLLNIDQPLDIIFT